MSKLSAKDTFFDLSDYGRPIAVIASHQMKHSRVTPVQVTLVFGLVGLAAVYCILNNYYLLAGILLILKSIIDAIDGELARVKKTPSYTGRFLDSIFDIILNIFIFLSIYYVSDGSLLLTIIAITCFQLQGTLCNYYYVILRNKSVGGDSTSRVFEYNIPAALPGENQKAVTISFIVYTVLYGLFDRTIYFLDKNANQGKRFSNWFMTFLSIYGLGFQLAIIAIMLNMNMVEYIIPFFIFYTFFIFVLIVIRKLFFGFSKTKSIF